MELLFHITIIVSLILFFIYLVSYKYWLDKTAMQGIRRGLSQAQTEDDIIKVLDEYLPKVYPKNHRLVFELTAERMNELNIPTQIN